ncbi:hypothetical protein TNCV_4604781 [Trichonephila clavipes]|nr:hypothetical protein TNCV_4604781 [Trichonephila clavipes]
MRSHTYLFGPQYGAYQISVHSPFNYNNPFVDGYETREGMSYYLDVSVVIKKTLPKPYETDCFDYLKKLKEEGRPGPTNQKENQPLTSLDPAADWCSSHTTYWLQSPPREGNFDQLWNSYPGYIQAEVILHHVSHLWA